LHHSAYVLTGEPSLAAPFGFLPSLVAEHLEVKAECQQCHSTERRHLAIQLFSTSRFSALRHPADSSSSSDNGRQTGLCVSCSFQWRCRVTSRSRRVVSELWTTRQRRRRLATRRQRHWRHTADTRSSASVPCRLTSASVFRSQLHRRSALNLVWQWTKPVYSQLLITSHFHM